MQKTTIVHLKAKRITAVLADSYPILIMFTVYITGIILGAALLKGNAKTIKKAETLYQNFISARNGKGFLSVFGTALMEWLPFLLALFVCGTCIAGMVMLPFFVGYKGFCYGALAGYIYSQYSFGGIVFVLIFIVPATIIGAFGLFFAAKRSFSFSLLLAKSVLPRGREYNMYNVLIHYCKSFAVLVLTSVFAALTDAALSGAFWDKIKIS